MAVKLYEKDPSKLTSMDEPLPTVSTSSDMSEDEDSNQAPEIKEEPMEVTASSPPPVSRPSHQTGVQTSFGRAPGWPENTNPSYIQAGQRERNSFSSSHEDPSTDSETVRPATHLLGCHFEKPDRHFCHFIKFCIFPIVLFANAAPIFEESKIFSILSKQLDDKQTAFSKQCFTPNNPKYSTSANFY
jgi:hypothetical protein